MDSNNTTIESPSLSCSGLHFTSLRKGRLWKKGVRNRARSLVYLYDVYLSYHKVWRHDPCEMQPLRSTTLMYKVGSWNCTSTTESQDLAKSEGIERYRVTIAHLPAKSKSIYTYLRSIHIQIMNPTHNMHLTSSLISKFTLSSPLYWCPNHKDTWWPAHKLIKRCSKGVC